MRLPFGPVTLDVPPATLDAIDITLCVIAVPTECQWNKENVPNGLPLPEGMGCREPNGEIDIFDILVIIDVVLERPNCCVLQIKILAFNLYLKCMPRKKGKSQNGSCLFFDMSRYCGLSFKAKTLKLCNLTNNSLLNTL